jgi:hypothetical protein
MRSLTCAVVVGILVVPAAAAAAQSYDPLAATVDPGTLDRELENRANAANLCWTRDAPVTVDWLAGQDAAYRQNAFSRYHLSEIEDGWHWVRRDASRGPDIRATANGVAGIPYAELEVHARGSGDSWALLEVDSELTAGIVRFEWDAPPEKLCMADGLHLGATVDVLEGQPGAQQIVVVLPLTQDQVRAEGPDVKACSPRSSTGIDSEVDYLSDAGRCVRELYHLDPLAEWSVWVNLPESFYVVYRYVPVRHKR